MPTISIKPVIYRHHRRQDNSYPVKLRVTFKGTSRHLPTTQTAYADQITRTLKIKDAALCAALDKLCADVRGSVAKLSPFALEEMTADDVVAFIKADQQNGRRRVDFFAFAAEWLRKKSANTAKVYATALSCLERYNGSRQLDCSRINKAFVQGWVDYIQDEPKIDHNGRPTKSEKKGDTAAYYVRLIAAIFVAARNRYNDEDSGVYAIPHNPFAKVELPAYRPKGQKALPLEVLQQMIDDQGAPEGQREALDIFLLSFALQGVNLADLYTMAPPVAGVLTYNRQKTAARRIDSAYMQLRLEPCTAEIVRRLQSKRGGKRWLYLAERWSNASAAGHTVNRWLKLWAASHGVAPFTYYAARHSWATIARSRRVGADKATVDEALAHAGNLPMADIYAERDSALQWEVNAKVLALLDWSAYEGSRP